MASGKRYKFQGSTISFLVGYDAESPSPAITSITQANPAVVTAAGHGLADGDVIKITGVVGMTEVNDSSFIVDVSSSSQFSLVDTDSTGYGAYQSGGHLDKGRFSSFCELTGYNRTGATKPEIEAATICSTRREYELGLSDLGAVALDFNFAPQTAIQLALADFDVSGDLTAVRIVLPKSGGQRTELGFVQQTSEKASVNGLWTATMSMKLTGAPFDVAAA